MCSNKTTVIDHFLCLAFIQLQTGCCGLYPIDEKPEVQRTQVMCTTLQSCFLGKREWKLGASGITALYLLATMLYVPHKNKLAL